jgi:hypothetical protein
MLHIFSRFFSNAPFWAIYFPKRLGSMLDHNFWRFLPIFGEKNWLFSQKLMLLSLFCKIQQQFGGKNDNFFGKIFSENAFEIKS